MEKQYLTEQYINNILNMLVNKQLSSVANGISADVKTDVKLVIDTKEYSPGSVIAFTTDDTDKEYIGIIIESTSQKICICYYDERRAGVATMLTIWSGDLLAGKYCIEKLSVQ